MSTTSIRRNGTAGLLGGIALLTLGLSGCAGMGADYSTPADAQQIPFTVEAVTPELVSRLAVRPPAVSAPPAGGLTIQNYAYRIGPTDVLSIFVNQSLYGDQGIAGTVDRQAESLYVVSEDGYIFLPLYGALRVAGLTVGQAYNEIQSALAKYITRPQINVRVAEFRSQRIAVAGAVSTPGYLPVTDRPMTITEAVIAAGQTDEADLRKVVLKRAGVEYPVDVFALIQSPGFGQNWVMQDGDVLFVPRNENRVYVLGEAPNRTEYIDPYATSLAEVLVAGSASGGSSGGNYLQTGTAQPGSIFVIRGDVDAARVFHMNGASPESFILADQFQLASGDIVYVSTRPVTRFNRFISQILPSLQSILLPVLLVDRIDSIAE
ncbi:polysaccharide biosynthesis/export family protein [Flagellatimonas centrodinii]|uniref:polysaccharide biosynthesis/export family protein n=1 Tax=Flagellatimonas centrodinii TaxID=2806210 RepID=UPI001FF7FBA3|nr:polysaccharide biosynthesis/export family protein [Flagellatimonas centrodinii]ULQ46692.1 polysaccharide biosynthesis/export family protein [Flagellatimonas centrodinii]